MSVQEAQNLSERLDTLEALVTSRDLYSASSLVRELEATQWGVLAKSPRFLLLKAMLMNQTGDFRVAIEVSNQAFDLLRDSSDNQLLALVQNENARAQQLLGHIDQAETVYRDVAATFRRAGNLLGLMDTLNRIASIRFVRADYREATRLLLEAKNYAESLVDEVRLAKIYGNLGQISIREGKLENAIEFLAVSIEKNGSVGNHPNLARAFLSLALVEIRLGNHDSARRNLRNALEIVREHGLKRELAIYYEYRAELLLSSESYDKALAAAKTAAEIAASVSPEGDLVSQSERLRAQVLLNLNRIDESEHAARKALRVAEQLDEKLEIAECLRILAEIADRNGNAVDSRQQTDYALHLLRELGAAYELANMYQSASRMSWVEEGARIHYTYMATEIFSKMGVEGLQADKGVASSLQATQSTSYGHVYVVTGASGESVRIVTANRQMRSTMCVIDRCKDSDIPILITGETGTGKDLLAKYIHCSSNRSGGNFVPVNCSAIPKELFESELFGHAKGAFTNAVDSKEGLITIAHQGTLFLNEIGELPLPLQAKLLGCIEEKRVIRVGDTSARPVDFRLVTATNRDLEEDVAAGRFRQDLYFRIAVMTIELPPLRQRIEDVFELLQHFMTENGTQVDSSTFRVEKSEYPNIQSYAWPGNIREMQNVVKLAAIEQGGDPSSILRAIDAHLGEAAFGTETESPASLAGQLAAFECDRIKKALASTDGVIRRAASLLRLPEATLRSKMRKYKI
jgi:transcriptional regulator with PAS, ATPase and Fis domain